jgi:hypothetical protein
MAGTFQRYSSGRLLLNVVTGGEAAEQRAYGDFLGKARRYQGAPSSLTPSARHSSRPRQVPPTPPPYRDTPCRAERAAVSRSRPSSISPGPEPDAMRIAVVTGNPKPASRTHGVALAVASTLSAALACPGAPASGTHLVVDVGEHAPSLFDPSDAELSRLTAEVAAAEPTAG